MRIVKLVWLPAGLAWCARRSPAGFIADVQRSRAAVRRPGAKMSSTCYQLRDVRVGFCPNETCRFRVLFRTSARTVKCRRCGGVHVVEQLRGVNEPKSCEEALEWMQQRASTLEKAGEMGIGRWRAASRAVDGISSHSHAIILQQWFERYGVASDGRVKRLKEMGRTDPINVATLSDYAFAIAEEQLEMCGYGRDEAAFIIHSKTINALNEINGRGFFDVDALIPLRQVDNNSPWSAAAAVSRACVGREVFAQILGIKMSEHTRRHEAAYKQRSTGIDAECSALTKLEDVAPSIGGNEPSPVVDLAVLANILGRTILLLDIDQPGTMRAFVPFLSDPKECRDWRGSKRSPIVLAWGDRTRAWKLAMVAPATPDGDAIAVVRVPRDWIKSVWGHSTEGGIRLLAEYVDFDDQGHCVVGHGKYFKPKFLQEYVNAFEKEAVRVDGVLPALEVDYLSARGSEVDLECSRMEILRASAERRLWRCLRCYELSVSKDQAAICCAKCGEASRHQMRHQRADGSVEYQLGDHTSTLAPNSWCFTKRKHFYYFEYDNPALRMQVEFGLDGKRVHENVMWFSAESNSSLNSCVSDEARKLATKHCTKERDMPALVAEIEARIRERLMEKVVVHRRFSHLKTCLGILKVRELFDDHSAAVSVGNAVPSERVRMWNTVDIGADSLEAYRTDDVKNIIASAITLYEDFRERQREMYNDLGADKTASLLREFWQSDAELTVIEETIWNSLETAMQNDDAERRWGVLLSEPALFRNCGLFYIYADRHFRRLPHFSLPLLAQLKFAFCDTEPALTICVDGAGHFPITEDLNIDVVAGCYAVAGGDPKCMHLS